MRIVCWQMILMKYHTIFYFFFQKLGKMSQNLLSAAVMIGAFRVKIEKKLSSHTPFSWKQT